MDGDLRWLFRRLHCRLEQVSVDIRTSLCPQPGIPPGKGLARPETGAAFFGDASRFPAAETALCRVPNGKAAESQRLFPPRQETGGALLFVHACRMGLEGIVSKRLTAPYRSGPSRDWIKVRTQIVRRLSGRGAERRFQWSLDTR
jgi:hypothetical protein